MNATRHKDLTDSSAKGGVLFEIGDDDLLTAEQLAARLNVAPKTIRKWRYERVLPPDTMVKYRHQVRYRWSKVLRWLQTNRGFA